MWLSMRRRRMENEWRSTTRLCMQLLEDNNDNSGIIKCVKDPELQPQIRVLLYSGEVDLLLDCIEAQINSEEDPNRVDLLTALQSYYNIILAC